MENRIQGLPSTIADLRTFLIEILLPKRWLLWTLTLKLTPALVRLTSLSFTTAAWPRQSSSEKSVSTMPEDSGISNIYLMFCEMPPLMWDTIDWIILAPPDLTPRPGIGFQISNVTECCSREWGDDTALSPCHHNNTSDVRWPISRENKECLNCWITCQCSSFLYFTVGLFLFYLNKLLAYLYLCRQQILLTLTHYLQCLEAIKLILDLVILMFCPAHRHFQGC